MEAGARTLGAVRDRRAPAAGERRDRALVAAAQSGSEDAIEELFRRHWPAAHHAAYLVTHDPAGAEDIAQEAFVAAIRALDRFDRRRPFSPWLHRIVVNRAIDWTRARKARREVADGELERVEAPADGSRPGLGADAEGTLEALRDLGPEHRAVVVLRYLLEYTPGEIAELLELPRGTVNSRLRRGLDALARNLPEEAS